MISENIVRVVTRWWWLVGIAVVATVGLSVVTAQSKPDVYQSSGSYVVRARATEEGDLVRATATQIAGVEINATYANIAESDAIEDSAKLSVDIAGFDTAGLKVDASVVPSTNLMKIAVRSRDPELSHLMAVAVGEQAVQYIDQLDGVFFLSPLDSPKLPKNPQPSGLGVTTFLAAIVGGGLGVGLAFGADRLFPPKPDVAPADAGSGPHEEDELRKLLAEEVSRSRHSGVSFRVAVLQVDDAEQGSDGGRPVHLTDSDLALVSETLAPTLRDHDHLAHLGLSAPGSFVAILPDLSWSEAEAQIANWKSVVSALLSHVDVDIEVGECAYEEGAFFGDPDAERIARSL